MGQRIKIRRDNNNQWATVNPVLQDGEMGFDTVTKILKIGNGVNTWANLPNFETKRKYTFVLASMTANSTSQTSHGFGAFPSEIEFYLRCKVANNNYSVNDRVFNIASVTHLINADATNISIRFGAALPTIIPKFGGSAVAITSANWEMVLIAYA